MMMCSIIQKMSSFINIWGKYTCVTSGMLLIELSIFIPSSMALLSEVLQMLVVVRNNLLLISTVWLTLLSSDVLKHKSCTVVHGSLTITCSCCLMKVFTASCFIQRWRRWIGLMFLSLWKNFILNTHYLHGGGRCGFYKPLLMSSADLGISRLKWDLSLGQRLWWQD